jgi:hypothetical protein
MAALTGENVAAHCAAQAVFRLEIDADGDASNCESAGTVGMWRLRIGMMSASNRS